MPEYLVHTHESTAFTYMVEAESEQAAIDMVRSDPPEAISQSYIGQTIDSVQQPESEEA